MNINDLKAQNDLRVWLTSQGYEPKEVKDAYSVFLCPFHSEKTPSFYVWRDHFKCFGCEAYGDIINFIINTGRATTTAEAIELLGKAELPPAPMTPVAIAEPKVNLEYIAQRHRQHLPKVKEYLEERKVNLGVAQEHWGGGVLDYQFTYRFQSGEPVVFTCKRVSLPNMFNGVVRGIKYRRDESDMYEVLSKTESSLLRRIRADMEACGEWSQPKMLDRMFGPRYILEKGSKVKVYNADLLATMRDGKITSRAWSYMLINEGKEIDVLSLLSAGYPIVGIPQSNKLDFAQLFSSIPVIFILADNDEAGINKAQWIRSKLGRGEIIRPPDNFKDANDVLLAGKLEKWLGNYNIKPILNDHRL